MCHSGKLNAAQFTVNVKYLIDNIPLLYIEIAIRAIDWLDYRLSAIPLEAVVNGRDDWPVLPRLNGLTK